MARAQTVKVEETVLDCGLRIAAMQMRSGVECCGIAVNAGSRDEMPDEYGLAHFVEHTLFKGTARRRAHHIINRMETVGGELNAYTTKEETFFYTVAPAWNLRRAVDLLCDLINNSTFPAKELDNEREVIADEIDSYLDTPADAVFDDFEDLIYAGSGLGHNILGNKSSIARFDTEGCMRWTQRLYRPEGMVFFYAGPASPARVFKEVSDYFRPLAGTYCPPKRCDITPQPSFDLQIAKGTHQSHTLTGVLTDGIYSADRHILALYNNILGGPGMNSRLNVALREHSGLVYTVESSLTLYHGTGLLAIYYGCDRDDIETCRKLTSREISRLADDQLSQYSLNMARRQYLGQMIVGAASIEAAATSLGKCRLRGLEYLDEATKRDIIGSITPAQLRDTAERIANSPTLSYLTFK